MCGGTAPKPTVVMDAGIATEENIVWLGEQGYDWIAVSRGARPPLPEGGPEALLITSAQQEVRAWRLASEDGEARLYVVSEGKKKAENAIIGLRRNRFEAALERLHGGLPVKGRLKRYDRVLESIGRLKQRFSAVARHYEITVEKAKTGPNAAAVRFKRRPQYDEADEGAGAYVLRTRCRNGARHQPAPFGACTDGRESGCRCPYTLSVSTGSCRKARPNSSKERATTWMSISGWMYRWQARQSA